MKVGVLFSGGKDSAYALYKALETEEVACLISVVSQNEESYMFHTPNIGMTGVQAEVMGIPLVQVTTEGEKEEELQDLERAIIEAHNTYGIEGVVTGAVESVYQATRIQKICHDVGVWCFNPLWLKDQVVLLQEIIENHFKVIITGIFAYPLDEGWLGKEIDTKILERLIDLKNKYRISPSGEGGEIETTVLDAPFFKKIIKVTDYEIKANKNSGVYIIKNVDLVEK
jgi:ABC transporter with metal-binding/Fe-S-binding domain ATP-binding protein